MGDIKENTKTLEEILNESGILPAEESKLILWNDDVNSFEWVIMCLISLLDFNFDRAEKSVWTVHLQGKDIVKSGSKDELLPYKKLLDERGLTTTIEE
jgi:ATP-dependent Clp protease adaptor protein ClpS